MRLLESRFALRACVVVAAASVLSACSSSSSSQPSGDGGVAGPLRWSAAVGAGGTFTQTFDAATWVTRSLTTNDLYAVSCVGNDDGWAAGAAGFVAHTLDSGRTWTRQDAHTTATLRSIKFGTVTFGVLAGDGGMLATTNDGGNTWTNPVARPSTAGIVLGVGDGGVVIRSGDRGATWSAAVLAGRGDLRGIASDDAARRVLAVDARGTIWASGDAGFTFAPEGSAGTPLDAVVLSEDGTVAMVVGARGKVLESDADGSWRAVASGTTADLHAALVTGEGNSRHYVAGEDGTLVGSSDHGVSWSAVALPTRAPLYALDDL